MDSPSMHETTIYMTPADHSHHAKVEAGENHLQKSTRN